MARGLHKIPSAEETYTTMMWTMLTRISILENDLLEYRAPEDGNEYTWEDVADIAYLYTVIDTAYTALHEEETGGREKA